MKDLLLITLLVVFIVDLSGFVDSVKGFLCRWLKVRSIRLKPFDCSLCMVWWTGLVWLLCVHRFTLPNIALVALLAFLSQPLADVMRLVQDCLIILIDKLYKLIEDGNIQ